LITSIPQPPPTAELPKSGFVHHHHHHHHHHDPIVESGLVNKAHGWLKKKKNNFEAFIVLVFLLEKTKKKKRVFVGFHRGAFSQALRDRGEKDSKERDHWEHWEQEKWSDSPRSGWEVGGLVKRKFQKKIQSNFHEKIAK
jgi:hypothetical protein